MKNALLIVSALLLLSLLGNFYQINLRNRDKIASELALANSNTIIATNRAVAEQKQAAIEAIRKERTSDSLKNVDETTALKRQISVYREKLKNLPQTVPYQPDSATVDSLRVAFVLKDSVIDTQALMITHLETEKQGLFLSFTSEIKELEDKNKAQVVVSNELQTQLVDEQGEVRKQTRKKKFWRGLSVGLTGGLVTAVGILVFTPK